MLPHVLQDACVRAAVVHVRETAVGNHTYIQACTALELYVHSTHTPPWIVPYRTCVSSSSQAQQLGAPYVPMSRCFMFACRLHACMHACPSHLVMSEVWAAGRRRAAYVVRTAAASCLFASFRRYVLRYSFFFLSLSFARVLKHRKKKSNVL